MSEVSANTSLGYECRLHYSWEYRRFFTGNEVIRLRECTLFRIPNSTGHFRVGITLKARGSSLNRNRAKRQIRENFRRLRAELGGFDYNVVVPGHRKLTYIYAQKLGVCLRHELPESLRRLSARQTS